MERQTPAQKRNLVVGDLYEIVGEYYAFGLSAGDVVRFARDDGTTNPAFILPSGPTPNGTHGELFITLDFVKPYALTRKLKDLFA
jgi:hypothetical protein